MKKKRYTVLLLFLWCTQNIILAQDYQINFGISGSSEKPDSVHVYNIDQDTELTINGDDILHLLDELTAISAIETKQKLRVYPNPTNDYAIMEFDCKVAEEYTIQLIDLKGSVVASYRLFLKNGTNVFKLSGLANSIYTCNIFNKNLNYCNKIISQSDNNYNPQIEYLGKSNTDIIDKKNKSVKTGNLIQMQYNNGEYLQFTAYKDGDSSAVETLIIVHSQTIEFSIIHIDPPVADFTCNYTEGFHPLMVTFQSQSTGGGNMTYEWDFGDGNTNTNSNSPSNVYEEPGIYTVSLTVSNEEGSDTEVKQDYITVNNNLIAHFFAENTEGEIPLEVHFHSYTTQGDPTSYLWSFGDGSNSTEANPIHTYTEAGTYTVSLTVTNEFGSDTETQEGLVNATYTPIPETDFTADVTEGFAPLIVNFTDLSTNEPNEWIWLINGEFHLNQNETYIFNEQGTYDIQLTASNEYGENTHIKENYITVHASSEMPVVDFNVSQSIISEGTEVNFTDLTSNSPESYYWEFGDGNTSTEQNPSHVYSNIGEYTVSLTVTKYNSNFIETKEDYIIVINSVPDCDFIANLTETYSNENIHFTDLSTHSPNEWLWDFGDGNTSTLQNPVHSYDSPGDYTVSLTATNIIGSDTESKTNYIHISITPCPYLVWDIDGNAYLTVEIGGRCWFRNNIESTHYSDNTEIPYVTNQPDWYNLLPDDIAYCYYDNSVVQQSNYNNIYTWAAATRNEDSNNSTGYVQGICPDGWHIPSDNEWKELEMALGMSQTEADNTGYRGTNEGSKMAGGPSWNDGLLNSDPEFNFSDLRLLGGGFRNVFGYFIMVHEETFYWSSTSNEGDSDKAYVRIINYNDTRSKRINYYDKSLGGYIRCVRDE